MQLDTMKGTREMLNLAADDSADHILDLKALATARSVRYAAVFMILLGARDGSATAPLQQKQRRQIRNALNELGNYPDVEDLIPAALVARVAESLPSAK